MAMASGAAVGRSSIEDKVGDGVVRGRGGFGGVVAASVASAGEEIGLRQAQDASGDCWILPSHDYILINVF